MTVIPHALTVANGKGGVGKTSLAVHIAGIAAISGWRVLAVDLDGQGNLAPDVGAASDNGDSIRRAIVLEDPSQFEVVSARERFDVIAGGEHNTSAWSTISDASRGGNQTAITRLGRVLAPVAADYDLVVIDTPPAHGSNVAVQSALACTGGVVIPVKADPRSLDGLTIVAKHVVAARTFNPDIVVDGVAVFAVAAANKDIRRRVLTEIEPLMDGGIPFLGFVRTAEKAALDLRESGQLAHEYERVAIQAAETAEPWYVRRSAKAKKSPTFSSAAGGLAGDYQQVVTQILAGVSERLSAAHGAAPDLASDVDAVTGVGA